MLKPCNNSNLNLTYSSDFQVSGADNEINKIISDKFFKGNNRITGCALGIIYENKLEYVQSYGYRNVSENKRFQINTVSGIGSCSKTLTSLGILKLYEQGRLSLDDKIDKYLSLTPPGGAWNNITIRKLLTHQSGLPLFPKYVKNAFPNNESELIKFLNGIIAAGHSFFGSNPTVEGAPDFDSPPKYYEKGDHPGKRPINAYLTLMDTVPNSQIGTYSNVGYALLGAIIDSIVRDIGYDYETFILNQIGLKNEDLTSDYIMPSLCLDFYWRKRDNQAKCYEKTGIGQFKEVPPRLSNNFDSGWYAPAGGWKMTIGDLTRLMLNLHNYTRISKTLTNEMLTRHSDVDIAGLYGYGIQIRYESVGGFSAVKTMEHAGGFREYRSYFKMYRELDIGIALMLNSSNNEPNNQFFNKLCEFLIIRGGVKRSLHAGGG